MSEMIDDIEHAIERASDVLHNSREWEAEGVYAEYIAPALDRARLALTAATKQAEAAEAVCDALRTDAARLNYLDTVRDPCPHHARRGVFGTEWSIVFTHPATHTPTIREAIDAALAVQPTPSTGPNT